MSEAPDWVWWLVGAGVLLLFVWYFVSTATRIWGALRRLVDLIQNWPQYRRAMVEAEARAGGRHPLWLRIVRVLLILAMVLLCATLVWNRLSPPT